MRLPWTKAIVGFFLAATLSAPAWAFDTNASAAVPGTLNYVEGQASMNGQTLGSTAIGSAQLQPGQSLATGNGKAEILLTPGVFLRLGDNSSVRMVSPTITNTVVGLDRGQAMVEVEQIYPQNDIRVYINGASTQVLKTGLYDFSSNPGWVRVFDGEVLVQDSSRQVRVKAGHEVDIAPDGSLIEHKFDRKAYEESDLYRWSSLRSAYDAEANVNAAGMYAVNGSGPWGPGWWGAGWYWDPWFDGFAFIPGDGIFYSPFGWGFYSPWLVYDCPFFGYWYGVGFGHYHHFSVDYHNWGRGPHYVEGRNYSAGIYHGPGSVGRGFHSGPRMVGASRSGGFRGGFAGGGFHGGFGGGGFHGGGGRGR
ncbi:MAG: FecR domain-containing protein [Candidatus Acidiferrum sp.]